MPRKGPAPRRELIAGPDLPVAPGHPARQQGPDPRQAFRCREIVYDALKIVEEKTGTEPITTLKRAIDNVKPPLEVKSRRVGGATYQVPVEVRPRRATTLAIRWSSASAGRREKTMAQRLAGEFMDAANGLGAVDQASRRHAEDGRGEQGLRPLPLVIRSIAELWS